MALDPTLGLAAAGRTAKDTAIVDELYDHTIDVILRAEALGGWRALDQRHTFDIEYWDLEQAKLRKAGSPPPFAGEVVLVTGAASGIGKACVESFLKRGAAVVALDRNPAIESLWQRPDVLGITCDLTDAKAIDAALDAALKRYGGIDMLVLNAGIFPSSQPIAAIAAESWRSAAGAWSSWALRTFPRPGRVPPPTRLPRRRSTSWRVSRRLNGRRTEFASTRCTRTRCSTPHCGPMKCSRRAPARTT